MKYASLAIAALLSTATFANSDRFYAGNDSFATKICMAIANGNGDEFMAENGIQKRSFERTYRCNGETMTDFIASIEKITEIKAEVVYELSAEDDAINSQICLDAVAQGTDAAARLHSMSKTKFRTIACNGEPIESFVNSFAGKKVKTVKS